MKSFTKVLASSVNFTSTTPAFSTSGSFGPIGTSSAGNSFSVSNFGSQGSQGGPTQVTHLSGLSVQANFGINNATSTFPQVAGDFQLLGSNTLERPSFVIIASSSISSTASNMLRDSSPWYKYVDFRFVPNPAMTASSAGFVSVILTGKGVV